MLESYQKTTKTVKYEIDRAEKEFRDAHKRGVKMEVIIHKNDSEVLKTLTQEGIISTFYSPTPTIMDNSSTNNLIMVDGGRAFSKFNFNGIFEWINYILDPINGDHLFEEYGKVKQYCIPIAPQQAEKAFKMISDDTEPKYICDFLTK